MGDFNAEPIDTVISDFCEIYNLKIKSRIKRVSKVQTNGAVLI